MKTLQPCFTTNNCNMRNSTTNHANIKENKMKSKFLNCLLLVCLLAFGYNAQGQNPDSNPNLTSGIPVTGGPLTDAITASWATLAASPKAQSRSFCVYIRNSGIEYIYQ